MIAPAAIALSGVLASSERVAGAAANLANSSSRGSLAAGTTPAPYQPVSVETQAQTGGGTLSFTRPVTPAVVPAYDPTAPYADANGLVGAPNVDQTRDLLTLNTASTAYRTNLAVLKTTDEMSREVLRMTA